MEIPNFKYYPNIENADIVKHGNNVCQCCGNITDMYISNMYCEEDVSCICLSCVSNGSAAEKFNGTFIQNAMKVSDKTKMQELFMHTPGYSSWQGEYWLACCDDYCEYLGRVGIDELIKLEIADEVITEYEERFQKHMISDYLSKDGSMVGYLFRCIHCGKYHLWVDTD